MARRRARRAYDGATAACAQTRWRSAARAAVAGCAVVVLAALPAGAQVLTQVQVVEPPSGAAVSSPRVVVEVRGVGQAESAQARIVAAGQSRASDLSGPESIPAGSRWTGNLHLSGLPNGAARIEARAHLAGASGPTEWTGHDVNLDLPAPAISLHVAPVAGRPDAVALTWTAAAIPDVLHYEVQRALAGQGWEGVLAAGADQLAHTDVGVPPGDHRYRVRAVRPGGSGGQRAGPWAEGVAILAGSPSAVASDGQPSDASGGPVAGVATAPRTGGIAARLRTGTENMTMPELPAALGPLVAPRDVAGTAVPGGGDGGGEEIASGPTDPTLAVSQEAQPGLTSDAVRLLVLGLVGLFVLWSQRPRRPAMASVATTGDEVWRGAREWRRAADAA